MASSKQAASDLPAVNALPDDVLVRIFSKLDTRCLLGPAARVCRRWRTLCHTPSLLQSREIVVRLGRADEQLTVQHLRSLQLWLSKHAAHVRSLEYNHSGRGRAFEIPAVSSSDEVGQLLASTLATCAALSGQLRAVHCDLSLFPGTFALSSWAEGLRSLESLDLSYRQLQVSANLAGLSRLQVLKLAAAQVEFLPEAKLPTSITCLHLSDNASATLPQQMSSLTALRTLSLTNLGSVWGEGGWDALRPLAGSLGSLEVQNCSRLPGTLSALTQLTDLTVTNSGTLEDVDNVGAMLAPLTGLRRLWLELDRLRAPAELAQLCRLERLFISHRSWQDEDDSGDDDDDFEDALPPGTWMAGIQHLVASVRLLVGSWQELRSATSLQRLTMCHLPVVRSEYLLWKYSDWQRLWGWVATHPPLQRLTFVAQTSGKCHPDVTMALVELGRARPALEIAHEYEAEL